MSATVIIPTTGSHDVVRAIDSVLNQTYPTTCYVVIDGKEHNHDNLCSLIQKDHQNKLEITTLPINVGANGFYGHRIYASFPHLVNTDYVLFLDQDNWLEPDHVENCVKTIEEKKLDWCYSLRNIYEGNDFVCRDDCESLGKYKPLLEYNHVDTNCYCIKTNIATKVSHIFHGGWGQDRVFYDIISRAFTNFDCSGLYTVNYSLGGNEGSVKKEFFQKCNELVNRNYNGVYPWQKRI